jgi:exopolysaccharide production protein ExoQ
LAEFLPDRHVGAWMTAQAGNPGTDRAALIAAALLALSLTLGGGGSPAPLLEIALQGCVALAALALLIVNPAAIAKIPAAAWKIAALVLIVPLVQLVPLPPSWWQALPGREAQIAALELTGSADGWRALSLSPSRTLASLLAAMSAMLCLVLTAALDRRGRYWLVATIATIGILSLLVGAAQLSGGTSSVFRFFDPNEIYLTAFQANHNSTADLLLVAMLALATWARHWLDRGTVQPSALQLAGALAVADGVMILALVLTASRAGIALLPIVLIFQYLILQPDARFNWAKAGLTMGGTAALGATAYLALRQNPAIEAVAARFDFAIEFRPELWRDSLYALGQYWPAGSGQGTFVPVIIAVERLEVVDPTLPNRAHNDYLELLIGAGLPGALVLAVVSALVLHAIWRALRQPPAGSRSQVLFAVGTLVIVASHSLVDYPLRSMALAALTATAVGLLMATRTIEPDDITEGSHP